MGLNNKQAVLYYLTAFVLTNKSDLQHLCLRYIFCLNIKVITEEVSARFPCVEKLHHVFLVDTVTTKRGYQRQDGRLGAEEYGAVDTYCNKRGT